MDPTRNNAPAAAGPWVPSPQLLWQKGRVYSLEEARAAMMDCFSHLLGSDRCSSILAGGGYKDIGSGEGLSRERIDSAIGHLEGRSRILCDGDVLTRSLNRLKFVLKNCHDARGEVKSPSGETFEIAQESDIAVAREAALRMAQGMSFSLTQSTSVATAVSELARNIVRYAGYGSISLSGFEEKGRPAIKILAKDSGPGIPNIDEVLSGTYRSKTGMGLGIVGTKRLMDSFDVQTKPGEGTSVTAIKYAR